MSTFNFDNEKIKTSESIFAEVSRSFYPDDQIIVKRTSSSEAGVSRERTLTSRTLADAISGDALFRSPKFALTFYNKGLSSSLNSLITGGSEAAFTSGSTYVIQDPEDPDGNSTITGGAAFSRAIVDSISGRKAGSDYIKRAASSISSDYSTFVSYPASSMNADNPHSSPDAPVGNMSMGGRTAVTADSISTQELIWLKERAQVLYDFGTVNDRDNGLLNGFQFDVPNNFTELTLTGTHYPGIPNVNRLDTSLITANVQTIYVSPTLIELLIFLNTKIVIKGGFGFQRGLGSQGSNGSGLQDGGYLTDHALGRAFDIDGIGVIGGTYYDLWNDGPSNADVYRSGLELLFNTLATAPSHLIPDYFKVSNLLTSELGLTTKQVDGQLSNAYEEEGSPLKIKYPVLRYCNVDSDAQHRNHIHISINSSRAGYYIGPGGTIGGNAPAYELVETVPGENRPVEAASFSLITPDTTTFTAQTLNSVVETVPGELRPREALSGSPATGASSGTNFWSDPSPSTVTGFLAYVKWLRSQNPFRPKSIVGTGLNPDSGLTVSTQITIPSSLNDVKFTKTYAGDPSTALDPGDVYAMLRLTAFSDEIGAIFAAIAKRESNLHPGSCNINRGSGDWSLGLWQLNMLPKALGSMRLWLPLPSTASYYGWQLGFKDWQTTDFGTINVSDNISRDEDDQYESVVWPKAEALEASNRYTLVNSVIFHPLNQVYALFNTLTGQELKDQRVGDTPEYRFRPWGDYPGGPPYGFISNVDFQLIADLYAGTGKPIANIQNWVLEMFSTEQGSGSKSAEYAENWANGWFYPVEWEGGWKALDPVPPESQN